MSSFMCPPFPTPDIRIDQISYMHNRTCCGVINNFVCHEIIQGNLNIELLDETG